MKYIRCKQKWLVPGLSAALALSMLAACGAAGETGSASSTVDSAESTTAVVTESAAIVTSDAPVSAEVDTDGAAAITLSGTTATVSGSGVSFDESSGVVTITAGGAYTVSGTLSEGRIIVDAMGEDVVLVLDGADITCSYGSPIYVYKSSSTTIHLADSSENVLTDGGSYTFADEYSSTEDDEPNACLYSKSDLIIQGAGSLTVNANYNNGVTSKDTLTIVDATLNVTAVNNGVTGKDSVDTANATVTVTCGGDAIRSTNDAEEENVGWVRLTDSDLTLTAGEDGVQAETVLRIDGGTYTITTGGGYQTSSSDSAKGLKACETITISDGTFVLDCSDDAVHSNGSIEIAGGSFAVTTGDDAFHADDSLVISGGELNIVDSHEGVESADITISGGIIRIVADDDGVNAGGGADSSGFTGGWGGIDSFGGGSGSVTISGGELYIYSRGDGLDSNGSITMTDGTVIVYSTGNADGALDYDGSFSISGGTLLAAGGGMPEAPGSSEQNTVYVGFGTTLPAGTVAALTNGNEQIAVELPVSSTYLVYSSPDMSDGEWTVSYGGSYSGDFSIGLGSGGTYSGGTELTTVTLSGGLTTSGSTGWGAMGGMSGPGGRQGGGNMQGGSFGGQRGFQGNAD